jgi:hypothetical protein
MVAEFPVNQFPIPEPVLRYEVPFADALGNAEPGSEPWRAYGQHQLWIGRYPPDAPPLYVQELRPEGLLEYETTEFLLHRVAAGTPYRVTHLMGFWHVSDADLLWFQIPRAGLTYYLALAGGRTNLPGNHGIVWYCGECAHEIYRQDFEHVGHTGRLLSQIAAPVVDTFNADAARRRCPACGWEHPPAYAFTPLDPTTPAAGGLSSW